MNNDKIKMAKERNQKNRINFTKEIEKQMRTHEQMRKKSTEINRSLNDLYNSI